MSKGRHRCGGPPPGSAHPLAKLKEAQVAAIKQAVRDGERRVVVAARYGICRETVGQIVRGARWKHVA
jgi:hypothetical protein